MGMSQAGFLRRLESGRAVNLVYRGDGRTGLISCWRLDGRYILTWEECPEGSQLDEATYTRDERHEFEGIDDLLAFLERHGHPTEHFGP